MFVCKICGNEVKSGQAFCSVCGADVVENYETICPVCGTRNGAGSRYCAKCGGILSVMRKPVCAVCGARNLPGAKFCVSCGAPIALDVETHSDADMIDARKAKQRLDNMARDRMAAVDREIAEKRAKTAEEKEQAMQEVELFREKCETEYSEKLGKLEAYKAKLNELGSDDVDMLKKISVALRDYSRYYADPYSQIDEDDIDGETYVCPACGTINPLDATACTSCGRNKARALLLLAKHKIVQSPPVKRKLKIINPPEEDLERRKTPELDEFENTPETKEAPLAEVKKEEVAEQKEKPADFSGPASPFYGYPFPQYPYGYPQQFAQGGYYGGMPGDMRQMPPIVQPVAFVPYVTQEQPLMQYTPDVDNRPINIKPEVKRAENAAPSAPQPPQSKAAQKKSKAAKISDKKI